MQDVQGSGDVQQQREDTAGRDPLAVQGVPRDDDAGSGTAPADREEPGRDSTRPTTVPPIPPVAEGACWQDGWQLYYNHIVQVGRHGRLYIFRDGTNGRVKTIVGILSEPVEGETVWHYAKCTCNAGSGWGWRCAHKAAALILARAQEQLPPGFPKF